MKFGDRILQLTSSTGTGTLTLDATPPYTYQTLSANVIGNGLLPVTIRHRTLNEWESCLATISSNTLTRVKTIVSSSGIETGPINFSAGVKEVYLDLREKLLRPLKLWKEPCVAVYTSTTPTSVANGNSVNGVTVATGDRFLAANSSAQTYNGIYVVGASASTRDLDAYANDNQLYSYVPITDGRIYQLTSGNIIGTDSLLFTQILNKTSEISLHTSLPTYLEIASSTLIGKDSNGRKKPVGPNALYTLSDGATVTVDADNGLLQIVTLGGNRTLAFSNLVYGQPIHLILKQDGTGSRTVTWPGGTVFPGGTTPTLTTTAAKRDLFAIVPIGSSDYLVCTVAQNF